DGDGPTLLGVNVPLALNTNLTSNNPNNLIRTILEGVREPAHTDVGFMPAFEDAFNDQELVEILTYMRARSAPQEPHWEDLSTSVKEVRQEVEHQAARRMHQNTKTQVSYKD